MNEPSGKKRKLNTSWIFGYDKAHTDQVLADNAKELAARQNEIETLKAEVARMRVDAATAKKCSAKEVAQLKAQLAAVVRQRNEFCEERDEARMERDATQKERDAISKERDVVSQERNTVTSKAHKWMVMAEDAEAKLVQVEQKLKESQLKRKKWKGKYDELKNMSEVNACALQASDELCGKLQQQLQASEERNDELQRQLEDGKAKVVELTEDYMAMRDECERLQMTNKAQLELGRTEGAGEVAAAKALAESALRTLEGKITENKRLGEQLKRTNMKLETATARLASIAEFQRKQMEMQRMLMSPGFISLEDVSRHQASEVAQESVEIRELDESLPVEQVEQVEQAADDCQSSEDKTSSEEEEEEEEEENQDEEAEGSSSMQVD